mgnify:CR=1 FL=1
MSSASTYAFRAVRPDGKLEAGIIEAVSREAAVASIGSRGIYPIEVSPQASNLSPRTRGSSTDVALGLRALLQLAPWLLWMHLPVRMCSSNSERNF